ncbi:hypothetical protein TanjilG_32452 [Lupinus angustifolius]|uniref:Protein kinase domain-containing protein n=1 Tax=Lupinus angustifolius TaxID=3871 RepID=A0A1J7HHR1_LUPAN|nr:PREDICTED: receptor-like protein kinase FERONIA [Lupinus angustifolius]OIW12336.1 hypothetical protein TanjilG_32452 [Lupinus angustifolius]
MSFNNSSQIVTTILFYLTLSLFYLPKQLDAYDPVVKFSINCGTSGNSSDSDRTWIGDINSKLLLSHSVEASEAKTQSPSTTQVPYSTATLSSSQFTYSFPVTKGPNFLRLFFNPSSYLNFNRTNSMFTVQSNGFTLLKDFNASFIADAEGSDVIFKEYIINVDDAQWLNLTFTPNMSFPNSYGFVNGIEVVSMPFDLYYNSAYSNNEGFKYVGSSTALYKLSNNTAMETEYRLRVGGQAIPPNGDTGLLRNWDGNDFDYLTTKSFQYTGFNFNTPLFFTIIPNYTAPQQLYKTWREMGLNSTLNKISNMTWVFTLHTGFTYIFRLHFCELSQNITYSSDRAFIIYIAEQVAEERADVIKWTQQKATPVYKDYAVFVSGDHNKNVNISLQLHPFTNHFDTKYSDPILNGLEIFKLSDPGTHNLAEPVQQNPVQQNPVQGNTVQGNTGQKSKISIIAGVVSGVVLVSIIIGFLFIIMRKKKKQSKVRKSITDVASKWGLLSFSTTKSSNTNNSSLPLDLCRHFTLTEIKAATTDFDGVFIVGAGGFGDVYKGYIDGGSIPVAIKRLKQGSQQGAQEFMNEIHMLSQLRHLHLVSLIGYCNESNEMILVYDFMTRGTLREHLYNTENPPLSWKKRLQICIGAARGLHYLHTGAKHTIIHRDVKTTNILIDEKWVAKVSDFGLSRIGPSGISQAHVTTVVKGSVGYLDPEYYKRQRLTEKSDVYSFGVVLFEVLCARPPVIKTGEKRQVLLGDWAKRCWKSGTLDEIVDPSLKGKIGKESLKKFGEIGVSCLMEDGRERPSMNDVVWMLEFALQLQENAENDICEVENREESNEFSSSVGHVSDLCNKSSGVSVTTSSTTTSTSNSSSSGNKESHRLISGTIFSEIMDPKGR